jgi:hypothetical protein
MEIFVKKIYYVLQQSNIKHGNPSNNPKFKNKSYIKKEGKITYKFIKYNKLSRAKYE